MKLPRTNKSIDIRLAIARTLPEDLQGVIWKTYNDTHVMPFLMLDVEDKLRNKEYESIYNDTCDLTKNMASTLYQFNIRHNMLFKICMDVTEDRICDMCITPTELGMLSMFQSIQENISNTHLLHLELLGECDALTRMYKKKVDGMIDSLAILNKLFSMIVPYELRDGMMLDIF